MPYNARRKPTFQCGLRIVWERDFGRSVTSAYAERLGEDRRDSLSKDLFGKENISGLIGFLIERWEKEKKKI